MDQKYTKNGPETDQKGPKMPIKSLKIALHCAGKNSLFALARMQCGKVVKVLLLRLVCCGKDLRAF